MSVFSKENMIPLMSLLTGMLVACGFFQWQQQPDPSVEAAVERFDGLTESEQTNVRNIAGAHLKNPSYSARMEAIHEEVQKDPALLPKLTALNELIRKQDRRVQSKLQPEGKFAEDWVQQVTELHRRDVSTSPVIEIRPIFGMEGSSPMAQISEDQVEEFFSAVLPDPLPADLQSKLEGLNKPDQTLERTLTKMIWVLQQLSPVPIPGKPFGPDSLKAKQRITDAMVPNLIDQNTARRIDESLVDRKPELADDPGRRNRTAAMSVCVSLFWHYERRFKEKHDPGDVYKSTFFQNELDTERRIALMKVDPADALSRLNGEIIEERNVANPDIKRLSQDIKETRGNLWSMLRRNFGSGQRRGDRGGRGFGGGRSGSPGPQGPRRPDDERPPRDRHPGDQPPGGERGRPDDNGPPGNQSPGGKRRRPPEDR